MKKRGPVIKLTVAEYEAALKREAMGSRAPIRGTVKGKVNVDWLKLRELVSNAPYVPGNKVCKPGQECFNIEDLF